ncbi:hypothetical protein BOX37_12840 [Nocardia mangyaensis]|uniref:3,4-dihydroxy-2-butanone-4-phosphate synthase n=1 Tax=Nocardia mangyaensis TaxID=2213200 RepID=A0A1J0VRN7_9NOCA|nr:3,4-dihydroxy-2-butanone-4-phosphate synthase [Nocardia mangyaensis]APE34693.1 hypothetical protein BOX37_12840 [Nocardia mangyaensis]
MSESIRRVERAVADLVNGKTIVLISHGSEVADGYLIVAAEKATTSAVSFMVRHTSGFICAAVTDEVCARVQLPAVADDPDPTGDRFTVAVDAATGVTTGISAEDRARTFRQIADSSSGPTSFTRPGHVIPIRVHSSGVLGRRRPAEAAADLMRAAGLAEVGALAALVSVNDPTGMADSRESCAFASIHDLNWLSVEDVVTYRRSIESNVRQTFLTERETAYGMVEAIGFQSEVTDCDYVTYRSVGSVTAADALVLVRFESDSASHLPFPPGQADSILTTTLAKDGALVLIGRCSDRVDVEQLSSTVGHQATSGRLADIAQILRIAGVTEPRLVEAPNGLSETLSHLGFLQAPLMRGQDRRDPEVLTDSSAGGHRLRFAIRSAF